MASEGAIHAWMFMISTREFFHLGSWEFVCLELGAT